MQRKTVFALIAAIAVIAAGCAADATASPTTGAASPTTTTQSSTPSDGGQPAAPTGFPPSSYAEFRQQVTACGADTPPEADELQFLNAGDAGVSEQDTIILETSCGPITILVDPAVATETVNSFVFLAEQGYFDGTVSHRVLPGFMMQAGDPTATGLGGPGYNLPDELPANGFVYERGVVAMANAGPNTGGSQFFIMFGTADWLPPNYAVFGQVIDGYDALDAIEQIPLGVSPSGGDSSPSTPLETIYIESVTIER